MKVAIFFGSKSDTDIMKGAANCLREFGVEFKAYVLSAHRVPERLSETLKKLRKMDVKLLLQGLDLQLTCLVL